MYVPNYKHFRLSAAEIRGGGGGCSGCEMGSKDPAILGLKALFNEMFPLYKKEGAWPYMLSTVFDKCRHEGLKYCTSKASLSASEK